MSIPFSEDPYGFTYGAAKVVRIHSNENKGWVLLGINTPNDSIQVYITKTGKIRVYRKDGELTDANRKAKTKSSR